ncbi:MAG: SLATT domain-containing protein, partial [Candidatus Omnitrophota bacterium]
LTAVNTFLNPNEKANRHKDAGNAYNSLRNRARIFHEIELETLQNEAAALSVLKELSKERDKLNKESSQIPKWAFQKARRGIQEGEATYAFENTK